MSRKSAIHITKSDDALTAAAAFTGLTVIDVFAAEPREGDKAPSWIKVTPYGAFVARDGRRLETNPATLVERFNADGVALPIDVDHATVKKSLFGDAAPAVGWIEKLEARDDGLYGQVTWLDEGLRILSARTHRYISPALKTDENGRALWLHSAALVASPGISMPAVASSNLETEKLPMLSKIAVALGLKPEATDAECLSTIGAILTRPETATHNQVVADLKAKATEFEALQSQIRKDKVDALLEGALTAKKITPAQKASYETLCATDAGFEEVKKLIETFGTVLGDSGLGDKAQSDQFTTLSAEDRDIMSQMGLSEEDYRKANGLVAK